MTSAFVFDNIFRELHDDLETIASEWPLNNVYIDFQEEISVDHPGKTEKVRNRASIDPERLQQQLQRLSPWRKKNFINIDSDFFYKIPTYLLACNSTFRVTFFRELRRYYNALDFDSLQQLTMLTHQMTLIHLHEQFWHRCLKSGTGQLKSQEQPHSTVTAASTHVDPLILTFWPDLVTSIMISKGLLNARNNQDNNNNNQDIYVKFVQNYLHQLRKQFTRCQSELDTLKKSSPIGYEPTTLDDKIERFIQHKGLVAVRFLFEIRMALIDFINIDRSLQWTFFQQSPSNTQLELAKRRCSLSFEKEKANKELFAFKYGSSYDKTMYTLGLMRISPPPLITAISDSASREQYTRKYENLIGETRTNLWRMLLHAVETENTACEEKFNKEIAGIWKKQHQPLPSHERLTMTMITIIEQRERNIIEFFKHIYDLKDQFLCRAPSMNDID